jgi:carboxyl-terminal processing protease
MKRTLPRGQNPGTRGVTDTFDGGPLLFVLGIVVGLFSALVAERVTVSLVDRDIELLRSVRNLAIEEFVQDVDSEELVDDALRGMLQGLDRYSRFYGPEEIAQLDRETYGEFRGIGVVFRSPTSDGQVLFPFPGSPASAAGIQVGDQILNIDGRRVAEMDAGGLQRAIQKATNNDLRLTVRGLDGKERRLVLELDQVMDPTVRHARMLDPQRGVGYLSIYSFSHKTPGEFDHAVSELQRHGLKSLVIDLRSNPGGILDAAVKIANRFIESGTIVATRTRSETRITEAVETEATLLDLPLVVLVDSGSASASEVLAGALQDHCAAAIVGERSYGKGTVQTLRRFGEDRAIIKLTTATYFTPSWRRIERRGEDDDEYGVSPDLLIELTQGEQREVYRFLETYSPPPMHVEAIKRWEFQEDAELILEQPEDRHLDAAVALLNGAVPSARAPRAH